MLFRKRNQLVGWLLILLGRRMTERMVRRRLRRFLAAFDPSPRRRSRRLPLLGAALAAVAAAALAITRQRH